MRGRSGFTLVELMVAMTLATILTGSIVFIFVNSQRVFARVDANVEVQQQGRYALERLQTDLAQVVATTRLGYFHDRFGGTPGRWDPGEEVTLTDKGDGLAYLHAFTIREERATDAEGVLRQQDSLLFKTMTRAGGGPLQQAIVEYRLDTNRAIPRLLRRTWTPPAPGVLAVVPAVEVVHPRVRELRFEVLADDPRNQAPDTFVGAAGLASPPSVGGRPLFAPSRDEWASHALKALVQTAHDPGHRGPGHQPDYGLLDPAEPNLFRTEQGFTFPFLRPGDAVTLWLPGAAPRAFTLRELVRYRAGAVVSAWQPGDPPSELRLVFEEPLPTRAAPTRIRWQTGWLPAAVRATLTLESRDGSTRRLTRVFRTR